MNVTEERITIAKSMDILSDIWGERTGYVFLPHIAKEFARSAKRKASWMEGKAFAWPADKAKIEAHLKKHWDDELYFSVNMFSKPSRKAENVLTAKCLYADLDEVDPNKIESSHQPTHAWQTSEGRYAGVWKMAGDSDNLYLPGGLNHRLTQHLGADPSGWDTTQVLRVPGSANNKAGKRKGERGTLVWSDAALDYPPTYFDHLPTVKAVLVQAAALSEADLEVVDIAGVIERAALAVADGQVIEYLEMTNTDGLDRSDVLWQIGREFADAGCSLAEIVAVTKSSIWNKYEGRQDEMKRLCTEAAKAKAESVSVEETSESDSADDFRAQHKTYIEREKTRYMIRQLGMEDARAELSASDALEQISKLPEPMTPAELKAAVADVQRWRIRNLIPHNGNCVICGTDKAGKTERTSEMERCLITGQPYLGHFEVEPIQGNILKLNYEVDDVMMSDWLDQAGFDDLGDRIRVLGLRGFKVPLMTDAGAEWLIKNCRKYDIEVLDLDPAGRMMTAADLHDEEDNNLIKRIQGRLDEIKVEAGVSNILLPIHAHREAMPIRPRGASAWGGWLDSQISLRLKDPTKRDGPRLMSAWGRISPLKESELEYDPETRSCIYVPPHTAPLRNPDGTVDVNLSEAEEPGIGSGRTGRRPKDAAYYDKRMQAYMTKNPKASRNWAAKEIGGTRTRALEAYDRWKLASDGGSKISEGLLDEDV